VDYSREARHVTAQLPFGAKSPETEGWGAEPRVDDLSVKVDHFGVGDRLDRIKSAQSRVLE
jgi:hypothetical protein